MSGYAGPDDESLHAIILAENGIEAARSAIPTGPSASHCRDCGDPIPEARRKAQPGCQYCVVCQEDHDTLPSVRMLDHIL